MPVYSYRYVEFSLLQLVFFQGYISAIPQEKWKDEMIKAQVMCVRSDEQCVESSYPLIADSVVMNAPSNANDSSFPFPDSGVDRFAKLDHSEVRESIFVNAV